MASYKLSFKRSAEKELRAIPSPFLRKVVDKIRLLSEDPRPHGTQMLAGDDRYFRIRQGDWRIIYEVNDGAEEVIVIKIGHRREVYK
ncbi:MAG: addiction module antitoxin [Omnitrophica bacterium RIFCSPLOWO2_01_FULL_50_24]|nr:MAG: addiction module antitoxin [Omnitrophica bacterium RIFCSPLOWO2_01_FULL_50_24]